MKFKITQGDLDRARAARKRVGARKGEICEVAQCLRRSLPRVTFVQVGSAYVLFHRRDKFFELPSSVQNFIFDADLAAIRRKQCSPWHLAAKLKPGLEFELEVPPELLPPSSGGAA